MLRSLSDIYQYFRENTSPVYFISPTSYNLLGIDEWIGVVQVHHLLRQLPRRSLEVVLAGAQWSSRLRVVRVGELLPARQQGGHRLHQEERTGQGSVRHVRRGDRGARPPARPGDRAAAARAAREDRLQDRHHPARQRGGCGERPERDGQGRHLQEAAQAGQVSGPRRRPRRPDAVRRLRDARRSSSRARTTSSRTRTSSPTPS